MIQTIVYAHLSSSRRFQWQLLGYCDQPLALIGWQSFGCAVIGWQSNPAGLGVALAQNIEWCVIFIYYD